MSKRVVIVTVSFEADEYNEEVAQQLGDTLDSVARLVTDFQNDSFIRLEVTEQA